VAMHKCPHVTLMGRVQDQSAARAASQWEDAEGNAGNLSASWMHWLG